MTDAFHSALRDRIAKPLGFPGDQDRGVPDMETSYRRPAVLL